MTFRFVYNEHEAEKLLRDPQGPVGRDLQRRATNVESQAKINASGRPGPNVQTGRLRSSITWQLLATEGGLVARIGSNVEYARFVEEGGDPPGSRGDGNPYLKPALEAARL